jgi:hypothetical protein
MNDIFRVCGKVPNLWDYRNVAILFKLTTVAWEVIVNSIMGGEDPRVGFALRAAKSSPTDSMESSKIDNFNSMPMCQTISIGCAGSVGKP